MLPPRGFKSDVDKRKQQITTLTIFNDNVTEITEDFEYEISFKSGQNKLVLKITLGNDFPKEKPILSIIPTVNHQWVNENGFITSAPGLLNFSPHSDLGRVVQAIIREFQRNPPQLLSGNIVDTSSTPNLNSESQITSQNFNFSTLNNTTIIPKSLQQLPVFPELHLLSTDELKFLNESEDGLDDFFYNLPIVKEYERKIENLVADMEKLADENLSKEERFFRLRDTVKLQVEEVVKLTEENEKLNTIYQSLSEKYSPRNIQEELNKAAKEADEEMNKIIESFLGGNLDVEKFLTLFIKARSLYQLRKTKEEKLGQQLDRLEKAGF